MRIEQDGPISETAFGHIDRSWFDAILAQYIDSVYWLS